MTKLATLLVFMAAGLATCQAGLKFGWYVGVLNKPIGSRPPDFSALEDWLRANSSSGDHSRQDMARIEANVGKFGDTGLRSAAKLLVDLSAAAHGQCNDHLLELIRRLHVVGLRLDGDTRTEKVVKGLLEGVLETCQQEIALEVEHSAERPQSMANLARIVRPRETPQSLESLTDPSPTDVNDFLTALSEGDPKTEYVEVKGPAKVVVHKGRFKYAFDKYLAWPCHQWTDQVAEQFAAADLISAIQRASQSESSLFQGAPFDTFRRLAWTRHACKYILAMTRQDKANLLDGLRERAAQS